MRVSNQKTTISYKVRVKLTSKVKHPCEDKEICRLNKLAPHGLNTDIGGCAKEMCNFC